MTKPIGMPQDQTITADGATLTPQYYRLIAELVRQVNDLQTRLTALEKK